VPDKPQKVVRNTDTTRTQIGIEYDRIVEDGGAAILYYTVYIDDGNYGAFTAHSNGLLLKWIFSDASLKSGLIYRVKYSSTNIHGESEHSNESLIMLAEVPSAPANLHRTEWDSLPAGSIMLKWSLPEDEGGDPVTGYKLYVDSVLIQDASGSSTMNEYIFTNLSVGAPYQLQVAAVNSIGESLAASLTLLAASVPQKLA